MYTNTHDRKSQAGCAFRFGPLAGAIFIYLAPQSPGTSGSTSSKLPFFLRVSLGADAFAIRLCLASEYWLCSV